MTAPEECVPWVCPRCGKGGEEDRDGPILALPKVVIRCTCGHQSWSS